MSLLHHHSAIGDFLSAQKLRDMNFTQNDFFQDQLVQLILCPLMQMCISEMALTFPFII